MVGQPGFDHHAAAIAKRRLDRARLEIIFGRFTLSILGDVRDQKAFSLHVGDDLIARYETVEPQMFFWNQPVGGLHDARLGIEHVIHVGWLDTCPLADLEIVEVMARGDLDHARSELRISMFVRHHLEPAASDWLQDFLADGRFVAFVIGVHRDRHIGQHRFGARRRNLDMA